jgi:hypothetical protein
MGLPYPGGPQVEALAATGDARRLRLPRPMLRRDQAPVDPDYYDFSFSGLKTAVAVAAGDEARPEEASPMRTWPPPSRKRRWTCSCRRRSGPSRPPGCRRVLVGGGVAANRVSGGDGAPPGPRGAPLRASPRLSSDNGAMVARAARFRLARGEVAGPDLTADRRPPLSGAAPPRAGAGVAVLTIVHGSDLHFGEPHDAGAAEAFLDTTLEIAPDLVVLSGDFTQRAKVKSSRPPGSSSTGWPPFPWWSRRGTTTFPCTAILERLLRSLPELPALHRRAGHGDPRARGHGGGAEQRGPPAGHRERSPGCGPARRSPERPLPRSPRETCASWWRTTTWPRPRTTRGTTAPSGRAPDSRRLQGHARRPGTGGAPAPGLHRNSLDVYPGADRSRGIVIVQSGTTTSQRGRAREREKNSFNVIRASAEAFRITHWMRFDEGFRPFSEHRYPRRPHLWFAGGADGSAAPEGAS